MSDPSLYDFLKQDAKHGFHENAHFIHAVHDWWLDLLDTEVRTSMGLVEETKYEELFTRYVVHVSHHVKKEKLHDKMTGKYVDPDPDLMQEVESLILAEGESREDFRRSIIGRIGAWSLENRGRTPDYRELFSGYIDQMESDYFARQKKVIAKNIRAMLEIMVEENESERYDEETRAVAKRTIDMMRDRFGYAPTCTAECSSYLLQRRYAGQAD